MLWKIILLKYDNEVDWPFNWLPLKDIMGLPYRLFRQATSFVFSIINLMRKPFFRHPFMTCIVITYNGFFLYYMGYRSTDPQNLAQSFFSFQW